MKNKVYILTAFACGFFEFSYGQNIAINTSGTAAAATNMFEVTQTSTAANMVALYAIHSGAAAGIGYGFQAIKTGASTTNIAGYFSASGGTNNYALIVPSTGGNVGIGTITPTYKFQVTTATDNYGIAHTDGTRTFSTWQGTYAGFSGSWIGSPSNHGLALTTNDLGRLYITNAGDVGIATTTPFGQFHINNSTTQASFLMSDTRTAGNQVGRVVYDGGTVVTGGGWVFQKMTDAGAFSANLVSIIQNTGHVGIGTITPQNALHVVATIPITTTNLHPYRTGFVVEGDKNTFGGRISIRQADSVATLTLYRSNNTIAAPTAVLSGESMGRIAIGGYDGSTINSHNALGVIAAENWSTSAHGTHLTFYSGSLGSGWGGTEKMRVTAQGNLGIATTTPGTVPGWTQPTNMRVLEVSGDGTAGTFSDGVLLLSNNRATATVGDQVGSVLFSHKNNPGNFPAAITSYLAGAGGVNGFGARLEFHVKPDNTAGHALRMLIDQTGNVGIGTAAGTVPSKLTIEGGYIQGTTETWGHQARTQGLIIIPEGSVTDDGAGNITFGSTLIVMNPLGGSYFRIAAGNYTFGGWGYMWVELPPTSTRGTIVTPTVSAWSDTDRAYDGRDRLLIGQRSGAGKVYFKFGRDY